MKSALPGRHMPYWSKSALNFSGQPPGHSSTASRADVRVFAEKMDVRGAERVQAPCVLVTRHLNNYGPVAVYLYSPVEFHIWSLHMFFDADKCREHFANYTLPQRARMPKPLARALARLMSHPIAWFFRTQIRAVPVWRGLKTVMKTFDLSVDELEKGENLLIMSDVHYAQEGKDERAVGQLIAHY